MTGSSIRPFAAVDEPVLLRATLDNLNWSEQRFTDRDVSGQSEFRHYTHLVLERGDFGFVAERDGEVVGVAWALFLSAADPGYGYVGDSIPEVSLWVDEDFRGIGLGRVLLRRLLHDAIGRGVGSLSLSVEAGNYAKRLYESEGFTTVPGRAHDGVMVWVA
jgi:GNAT superfamily N-acetyltransferase